MATNQVLLLLCVAVLALISLGFQIYVARKLSTLDVQAVRNRRFGWLVTYFQGWQNAKEAEITDVMIMWSLIVGFLIILLIGIFALDTLGLAG